jgi:hypothetical protein
VYPKQLLPKPLLHEQGLWSGLPYWLLQLSSRVLGNFTALWGTINKTFMNELHSFFFLT